ncbi:hypothetical protein K491DRAFT_759127 [Lophiostoma macrostomum CBS 122681]|uniref:Uncharacterized protein n=1 Tax=Lophiostoma macrostomum CBS 122681 TaxID=1314788 RepID=A0A6A6T328_9PLEO|nr:hypothetical protein K491DRAFT_759127 [Lophiostoma macrostomum CBS 122681]
MAVLGCSPAQEPIHLHLHLHLHINTAVRFLQGFLCVTSLPMPPKSQNAKGMLMDGYNTMTPPPDTHGAHTCLSQNVAPCLDHVESVDGVVVGSGALGLVVESGDVIVDEVDVDLDFVDLDLVFERADGVVVVVCAPGSLGVESDTGTVMKMGMCCEDGKGWEGDKIGSEEGPADKGVDDEKNGSEEADDDDERDSDDDKNGSDGDADIDNDGDALIDIFSTAGFLCIADAESSQKGGSSNEHQPPISEWRETL